jgi:hypothetical protein
MTLPFHSFEGMCDAVAIWMRSTTFARSLGRLERDVKPLPGLEFSRGRRGFDAEWKAGAAEAAELGGPLLEESERPVVAEVLTELGEAGSLGLGAVSHSEALFKPGG